MTSGEEGGNNKRTLGYCSASPASRVWCPHLRTAVQFLLARAGRQAPVHEPGWCVPAVERVGGHAAVFLRAYLGCQRQRDDSRVLHLTASRSNNCESHLSGEKKKKKKIKPPCDWSVSTGSFKAAAHIAPNREQRSIFSPQDWTVWASYIR